MKIPASVLRISFWGAVLIVATASLVTTDMLPAVMLNWWDKAEHALAYAGLAFLGWLAYPKRRRPTIVGLMIFGAAIEVAQHASGWRSGDIIDWLADDIGLAIGSIAAIIAANVLKLRAS